MNRDDAKKAARTWEAKMAAGDEFAVRVMDRILAASVEPVRGGLRPPRRGERYVVGPSGRRYAV